MKIFFCLLLIGAANALELNLDEVKSYIDGKFAEARVEVFPYPHIIIEDILPSELYDELEKNLPTDQRAVCDSPDPIWQQFAVFISDQILKKKIVEMFRPYTSYMFGMNITDKIFFNSKNLNNHQVATNYYLNPHVDQGYIFAPVMIYMPISSNDPLDLGTCLFTHLFNHEALDVEYASEQDVSLVKIAPYKKNTLFTFMHTPNSWHGSRQPSGTTRRLYISHIFLSEQFMKSHYHTTFNMERDNYVIQDKETLY